MTDPATGTTVLEATELSRKKRAWRVELSPERLAGRRADGACFELDRSRLADQLRLADHRFARRVLAVRKPRRTTLQFDEGAYRTLRGWLGRPLLLQIALKQRLTWTMPIAALFLFISLPLPADPAGTLEAVPFDPVNAALAGALLLQGMLSRIWPRRIYFLLDSLWLLVLGVDALRRVAGGASPLWLPVVVLQILLIRTGVRNFRRFDDTEAPPPLEGNRRARID